MQHAKSRGLSRHHLLVLIAALAAGLGLWLAPSGFGPQRGPAFETVYRYPAPRDLPAFALQAPGGEAFTPAQLTGRWHLVFIGFTHCPDVCPTTLAELAQAEKRWSEVLPEPQRPRIVFVSVDPERDSPEGAMEYARYFSPHALAASGNQPALESFARSLGMVFMKTELPSGDYTVDHSTHVALIDPQGRLAGIVRTPLAVPELTRDMLRIASEGA
jgi:protein SCO1